MNRLQRLLSLFVVGSLSVAHGSCGGGGIGGAALSGVVAGVTIADIKRKLTGLLNQVRGIGHEWIAHAEQAVQASLSQLDSIAKEHIDKPIEKLTGTARTIADRAILVADQVQQLVKAETQCVREDVRMLVGLLDVTVSANVSKAAFWSSDSPFVVYGNVIGNADRRGLRTDSEPTGYRLLGSFSGMETGCSLPKVSIDDGHGHKADVRVLSADVRSIVLDVPTLKDPGLYTAKIAYRTRERTWYTLWLDKKCVAASPITSALVVARRPTLKVDYQLKATCPVFTTRHRTAEVNLSNDDCDGDKGTSSQICPNSGTSHVGHSVEHRTGSGCRTSVDEPGGGCVRLWVTCPEKGGAFCSGSGKSWVGTLHFDEGFTVETPANEVIRGNFVDVKYDDSTQRAVVDPTRSVFDGGPKPDACKWDVAVSIMNADGKTEALPTQTGNGILRGSNPTGSSYEWNPGLGTITVQTPAYGCAIF